MRGERHLDRAAANARPREDSQGAASGSSKSEVRNPNKFEARIHE
jgi:hypothetical protein